MLEAMEEIDERVQEQIDENQREYYLREQMKVISQELGDTESSVSGSAEIPRKDFKAASGERERGKAPAGVRPFCAHAADKPRKRGVPLVSRRGACAALGKIFKGESEP